MPSRQSNAAPVALSTQDVLAKAKSNLSAAQLSYISQLENSVVRGDVKAQQVKANNQLATYWTDSLHQPEIAGYYFGQAAKLENSEKKPHLCSPFAVEQFVSGGR